MTNKPAPNADAAYQRLYRAGGRKPKQRYREMEAAKLAAEGLSKQEIARRMMVDPRTVSEYLWRMKRRGEAMNIRFYHTSLRGYVVADVQDAGTKLPVAVATGDELLMPEPMPGDLRKQSFPMSKSMTIVYAAAKAQPDTVTRLAERTGYMHSTIQHIVTDGPFVTVGQVKAGGRLRKIWGVSV